MYRITDRSYIMSAICWWQCQSTNIRVLQWSHRVIEAIKNKKKCICIVLKDRDDPDLGLNINITLALGLPSLCEAPANFSQCPALLHLDPKSTEAQAFNQLGHSSNSPSAEESSENGKKQDIDETGTKQNGASYKGKSLLESLVAVAGLLIWFY